jgi:hypothetical protein
MPNPRPQELTANAKRDKSKTVNKIFILSISFFSGPDFLSLVMGTGAWRSITLFIAKNGPATGLVVNQSNKGI